MPGVNLVDRQRSAQGSAQDRVCCPTLRIKESDPARNWCRLRRSRTWIALCPEMVDCCLSGFAGIDIPTTVAAKQQYRGFRPKRRSQCRSDDGEDSEGARTPLARSTRSKRFTGPKNWSRRVAPGPRSGTATTKPSNGTRRLTRSSKDSRYIVGESLPKDTSGLFLSGATGNCIIIASYAGCFGSTPFCPKPEMLQTMRARFRPRKIFSADPSLVSAPRTEAHGHEAVDLVQTQEYGSSFCSLEIDLYAALPAIHRVEVGAVTD